MATVTYYFNAYDPGTAWDTDPGNMVDGSNSTYANQSTGGSDTQLCDGNTGDGTDLGTITKVELRGDFRLEDDPPDYEIELQPIFTGGNGDLHSLGNDPPGTHGWSDYLDITTDTNWPNPWTWNDVRDLECNAIGLSDSGGDDVRLYKIEIRVTYTIVSGYTHTVNGVIAANMGKINGVAKADIATVNQT